MVLCKFYQQGYCKFGDNCRFEHTSGFKQNRNDYYKESYRQSPHQQPQQYSRYENSNRYEVLNDYKNNERYRKPNQNQSQNATGDARLTFEDFVLTTINEIGVSANSQKQWPLSCFGPCKEGDLYPGLEDVSPEEWRWEFFQSHIQGNVNEFIQKIAQMVVQQDVILNEIRNRTPEAMAYLQRIYQGQKINVQSPLLSKPAYGSQNENLAPSIFSFRQAQLGNVQSSGFINTLQSQETNAMGIPLNNSFDTTSFNQQSQPVISTPSSFSFRTPQQQNQQQFPTSGFGRDNVGFQNNSSAFGNNNTNFGANNVGFENSNQGLVVLQNTSGSFKQNEQSFTSSTPTTLVQANSGYKKQNSIFYSNADELSGEEREQFSASSFVLGKVPTNPPSYEFC